MSDYEQEQPSYIGHLIALAVCFVVLLWFFVSSNDCEKRGGVYVQTLTGFVCIEKNQVKVP